MDWFSYCIGFCAAVLCVCIFRVPLARWVFTFEKLTPEPTNEEGGE